MYYNAESKLGEQEWLDRWERCLTTVGLALRQSLNYPDTFVGCDAINTTVRLLKNNSHYLRQLM